MKKLMVFAVLLMSLTGCGGSDKNETQMTVKVAAYRTSCSFGVGIETMCHVVENENAQIIGGWPSIAGFNFVWGHEYVLVVGETIGEQTIEGPIITRRLIAVKSDQIADADKEFQYTSYGAGGVRNIQLTSSTGGKLRDNTPFVCLGDAQCTELAALLEDPTSRMSMTFGYSAGTSLPLVLKSSTRI